MVDYNENYVKTWLFVSWPLIIPCDPLKLGNLHQMHCKYREQCYAMRLVPTVIDKTQEMSS